MQDESSDCRAVQRGHINERTNEPFLDAESRLRSKRQRTDMPPREREGVQRSAVGGTRHNSRQHMRFVGVKKTGPQRNQLVNPASASGAKRSKLRPRRPPDSMTRCSKEGGQTDKTHSTRRGGGKTHRQVHSPALEVDNDDEHQRCREEVGDVGQVLPVERLLQSAHLGKQGGTKGGER